eukprot:jgi/Mesvir1/23454/Mv22303-RA.1
MDRAQTFAGFGVEPPVINEADEYATTLLFPLIDEPSSVVRQWLLGMVCNFVPPSQFVSSFSVFLEEEFVTHASEEMTEARCPFFISDGSLILSPACRQKSDELWGEFQGPPGYSWDIANRACSWCRQVEPGVRLTKCAGCLSVRYCSKDCQSQDWHLHRTICQMVAGYRGHTREQWVDLVRTNLNAYFLMRDYMKVL